jgi:phage terminase small subunit
VLTRFAVAFDQFLAATSRITVRTMIMQASNGSTWVTNPYPLQRHAAEVMQAAAVELGFSPASRASIAIRAQRDAPEGEDSPWAEFMGESNF